MYSILIVDDDLYVLSALRRELLRKPDIGHDGLEIETFTSPSEALHRVESGDGNFDAAIVDYRMPEMDGVTLLSAIREIQPDTVRIILSGHVEMQGLIDAINMADIDHFIHKPWNEYALKGVLLQALKHHDLKVENRRLTELLLKEGRQFSHVKPKPLYKLMAVDDEDFILKALKRELDGWNHGLYFTPFRLEVALFTAAGEALNAARREPFDLVIADYAMPGIDGVEFLRQFRHIRPDAARILLSGKADVEVLAEAVNQAGICHFIRKPWRDYELAGSIIQALAYRDMEMDYRILADLARLGKFAKNGQKPTPNPG